VPKTKVINSIPCPDCAPPSGCLTCDQLALISTDNTVKITRQTQNTNGKCIWNLRVGQVNAILNKADSPTVQWEGNGGTTPLKAHVKLSSTAGNLLTADATGLLLTIDALGETPNAGYDSPTILTTTSGTAQRTIRADLKISEQAGNVISILGDGLFVSPTSTDVMYFKPGDVGFPAIGATSFSPSDNAFLNKKIVVLRNFIAMPNVDLGDGTSYFVKATNSNTMLLNNGPMTANDFFIIIIL